MRIAELGFPVAKEIDKMKAEQNQASREGDNSGHLPWHRAAEKNSESILSPILIQCGVKSGPIRKMDTAEIRATSDRGILSVKGLSFAKHFIFS